MRRRRDIGIEGETMTDQTAAAAKATASTMMRYDANKKSMVVSYLLWFFLGMLGAHRFFLGQKHSDRPARAFHRRAGDLLRRRRADRPGRPGHLGDRRRVPHPGLGDRAQQ
jgi:hypothetical protein